MPSTTASRITAPGARPPYRPFAYQPTEMGGTLPADATLAEQAAHSRDAARHCLICARGHVAKAYSHTRRYRTDRRWSRVPTNPEARHEITKARTFIRGAAAYLRDAAEMDALAVLPLRRAA